MASSRVCDKQGREMSKRGRGRNPGKPWELLWLEPPKAVLQKLYPPKVVLKS